MTKHPPSDPASVSEAIQRQSYPVLECYERNKIENCINRTHTFAKQHLRIYAPIYHVSVYLSVCLFVRLSVYLSVYLSIICHHHQSITVMGRFNG